MINQITAIVPSQFLTLLRIGSHGLSEREQVTAISWLVSQTPDPAISKTILDSVAPAARAKIESHIDFNNQVTKSIRNYCVLFEALSSTYRNFPDTRIGLPRLVELQLRDLKTGDNLYESVEINKINYLLTGSFHPIMKPDSEDLNLLPTIFGCLHTYHSSGCGAKTNLKDLKEYFATVPDMERFTEGEYEQKLSTFLERAKQVTGIVPFPTNVE